MPLNGRQFLDLVGLARGHARRRRSRRSRAAASRVFGERSITNSFLVDGMENNDDFTRDFAEFYIQDVIQEFKVELGGYQGRVRPRVRRGGQRGHPLGHEPFSRPRGSIPQERRAGLEQHRGARPAESERQRRAGTARANRGATSRGSSPPCQYFTETRGNNFDLSRRAPAFSDGWFSPTRWRLEQFDRHAVERAHDTSGRSTSD